MRCWGQVGSGAWSPKIRSQLRFHSVEGHLGLASLGGAQEWLLQMEFSGEQRIRKFQAGRELKNHLVQPVLAKPGLDMMAQHPVQMNIKWTQTWPREASQDHQLQTFPQHCQAHHMPHPHIFLNTSRDCDSTCSNLDHPPTLFFLYQLQIRATAVVLIIPELGGLKPGSSWTFLWLPFEVECSGQGQAGFRVTCELGCDSNNSETSHLNKFQNS